MPKYKKGDRIITTSRLNGTKLVGTVIGVEDIKSVRAPVYTILHDHTSSVSHWTSRCMTPYFDLKELWKGLIDA